MASASGISGYRSCLINACLCICTLRRVRGQEGQPTLSTLPTRASFGVTGHGVREGVAATWNAAAEGRPVTTDEIVELIQGISCPISSEDERVWVLSRY